MLLNKRSICVLSIVFFLFLFGGTAIANNSLANAYYTAFVNPHQFDSLLYDEVKKNSNFYNQFETCSQIAPPALARLERQLRGEFSVCPNNARCTQLAKDIKTVMDLQLKVNYLIKYISAKRNGIGPGFSHSEIGRAAFTVYNFHKSMGIDIRNNPVFNQEMGILNSLVCP